MKALKDFRVVTLCPHCHGEILFTVDVKKNGGIAWNVISMTANKEFFTEAMEQEIRKIIRSEVGETQ